MSGAVALISRGTCTFADKSYFAAQAGAVAAVIYNNLPGLFDAGTLGGENASLVATAAVSQEDGLALVASHGNTTLASDLDIVTVFNTIYRYVGALGSGRVWIQTQVADSALEATT